MRPAHLIAPVVAAIVLSACGTGGSPEAPDLPDGPSSAASPVDGTGPRGTSTPPDDACAPEQLTVTTAERPAPVADETLFVLRFTPGEGVTCALRGAPEDLEFLDANGNALPVEVTPAPNGDPERVVLTGGVPKVVYLSAPKREDGQPAAKVGFTLPGGLGGFTTHDWPAPVTGPVTVAPIGDEVG
ncbi:hypothetical protein KCV87_12915 [Actinosynnema pretiosum subsp. pretiosum]|uniref:DUF4232 domain-containing protein n=1 Tax=Actinosynnema pretiosum subsp. pretiosum TaxID=103721 RepID=A0AA45LBU3_9PSEU|nr:hypothetical protein KCV87_12915 [Actinosynnema pretiosum subsp. pretiosum]